MVLFPKQRIFNQVAQASQASEVSTFFLENLLEAKPEDTDLRLLLAHHNLELGNLHRAEESISSILLRDDPEAWFSAQILNLRILEIRTFALPEKSQERREGMKQIGNHIEMLVRQSREPEAKLLTQLAQSALMAGYQNLAQSIYEQLGQRSEPQTAEWYVKAAELALGQGAYQKAAALYFSAQGRVSSREHQRRYYLAALKALQAGNFLYEAIQKANKHLGPLQGDEATLFFLVSLGRAAGDGAFAEKYVKDLLRASLSGQHARVMPANFSPLAHQRKSQFVFAPVYSQGPEYEYARDRSIDESSSLDRVLRNSAKPTVRVKLLGKSRLRPFNDQIYQLGYSVFLENQNLADAFTLAKAAVRQAPHRLAWRKRFAQVAEWTGRQDIALAQWREIAEKNPSQEPFEQILRLAPGAYDDENVIFALLGLGKVRSLSLTEWRNLSDAFERVGKPQEAITYLTHLHRQSPDKTILEQIAALYQRMGKGEQAFHYYRELEGQYGSTLAWTTKQASVLSSRGDLRGAYAMLQAVRSQASDVNNDYWELVGHLAWMLEDDQQAKQAYRLLWKQQQLSIEAQERLILLLRPNDPDKAIEVGLAGWASYHSPKFLLEAFDLLLQKNQIRQLQSLLEGLLPWEKDLVAGDQRYWVTRGEVMWKIGNKAEALRSYEQALALNPESSETQEAFLWFLVDQKNTSSLKVYLNKWRDAIEANSRLWGPVAAAYVVLEQPEKSLPFFVRQLKKRKHDYLWLLNYAAALEASSRTALAWQVRQQAWIVVRQDLITRPANAVSPEILEAFASLASSKDPGDQLLNLLRQARTHVTSPVMKELVLSWFLSQEAFEAAKVWLWKTYAQQFKEPGWAKLAIALAENNWVAIDAILVEHADNLSISDRVEAANTLDRKTLAQDLGFQNVIRKPNDDNAYFQYQEAIGSALNHITSRVMFEERSPLSSYVSRTSMPIQVGRVEVKPEASVSWQGSTDSKALTGVPRVDRQLGLSLRYQWPAGSIRLTGFHRKAVSSVVGLGMEYEQQWNGHFSSTVTAGLNHKADDSIPLQVGGVKDFIRGQGLYYFSKREFLSLQIDVPRFLSQSRDALGHGLGVEGVIGHHIRREYPDVTVRLLGTVQRYWRGNTVPGSISRLIPIAEDATPNMVVPEGFAQSDINISIGDSIRTIYAKGIRPFGLLGMNYNSVTGIGRSVEAGIAARLLGQDRLLLYGSNIRGGFGQNATTTRFNVEYQRWF